ncbi:flagellin [Methanoculleus sp. FWC-SCC1]|uniref:Flagellin n=1 Tax=Methanoculleus frigidifontis TaxID=2584085 RepID=A0ABT8M619_9EURY|nr:flagellin [Methanoculleus sp. FWC-SCC1]MDN7023381.1 flagellin [Methanoculleus sp. FWC-SCC1]
MSSETFTTAMFLMAAIISAGVLINAIFPVIYTLSDTIASSTHQADERLRVDVKIVTTYASAGSQQADIWIKNVGTQRIAEADLEDSDVFLGAAGTFDRLSYAAVVAEGKWTYEIEDSNANGYWDAGETLHITGQTSDLPDTSGDVAYFQFVLMTGLSRSTEFTMSG